jgi:hypothetical protein
LDAEFQKIDQDHKTAMASLEQKNADLTRRMILANQEIQLFNKFKITGLIYNYDPFPTPQEPTDEYESNLLSDDDADFIQSVGADEAPVAPRQTQPPTQKKCWLIRHSGPSRLTFSNFNACHGAPSAVECISFLDTDGFFTTYLNVDPTCKISEIVRKLSNISGIIDFKVVKTCGKPGQTLRTSRCFWKIAAAIHSNDPSLWMEKHPSSDHSQFHRFITNRALRRHDLYSITSEDEQH